MGEGKMAFETAAGQVFLEANDESMTPFGGFVPLAAFFEKLAYSTRLLLAVQQSEPVRMPVQFAMF